MDELIARIVAKVGIDEATAREAVAIILRFIEKDGDTEKVAPLIDAIPGSREFLAEHATGEEQQSGLFGGLGNMLGGLGGAMGAMAALNQLTSAGLDIDQVKGTAGEIVTFAKEKTDPQQVDAAISSIPGLSQIAI